MLGTWVSEKIEQTARAREAGSAAVYMGHFISPLVQHIAGTGRLMPESVARMDTVMQSAALRLRVVGVKIWNTDGQIVYSNNESAIGTQYPIEGALERALDGRVSSEFNAPDAESLPEFAQGTALLEIYAPIRSDTTGEVIAVAEFYEDATDLAAYLRAAQLQSWLVTGIVLASIFTGFSALVRDGSRTIENQRRELTTRISELSETMLKMKELRERIDRGVRDAIEDNERFLKTVGSELHDGPAQLIGLAQLRLDQLDEKAGATDVGIIRRSLRDAMTDIRRISSGLLLPNLEEKDLLDCIKATVRDHEARTQTRVAFTHRRLQKDCPQYVKICLCRFIQEGLTNAFRHAGATGQKVVVEGLEDGIRAQVSDSGPGIREAAAPRRDVHLGLIGLRGRLESIRGTLSISSSPGAGTTLTAWLPIGAGLPHVS